MDRNTSTILLLMIICNKLIHIRTDTTESQAGDTMANAVVDTMMARILQMCDPTKMDMGQISQGLMTPLLSIPENIMNKLNGNPPERASADLMGMMLIFNPITMAQGNTKTIQECMNKAAEITDMCAKSFVIFHCVYEQNMAAFG